MKDAPIPFIDNYHDAYELGKKYIDALNESVQVPYKPEIITELPLETASKRWSMTLTALRNTLTYIFKKLHHPCYMVCISDNQLKVVKLVMKDSSETFKDAIRRRHIPNLQKNKMITPEQRHTITKKLNNMIHSDKLRIMQCIVKKQNLESSNFQMIQQYIHLLSEMKLPNGVFILNLTDAVILKNDGHEPFPLVTGDVKLDEYNFREYIPILGMSGEKRYRDVPIPNYDDVEIALSSQKQKEIHYFTTAWKDKKIIKAVFRGGPSGCGYTAETNMRIKLAGMKSEYLDVGITTSGTSNSIQNQSIKFDPKYGLGMMNLHHLKPVGRLTMAEQSKYKYIIHIDGNVNAYRLLTTMCTGSLILRVSSEYRSWVDHLIQPGVHYVPVKSDLSNLHSCIKWCLKQDGKCEEIAKNGRELASSVLQKEYMKNHFQNIFWFFSNYRTPIRDKNPSQPFPPPLQYDVNLPIPRMFKKKKPVDKLPSPRTTPPSHKKDSYPKSPSYSPVHKNETYDDILHMQWKFPIKPSSPKTPSSLSQTPLLSTPHRKLSKSSSPFVSSPSVSPPITPETPISSPGDSPPHVNKTKIKGGYVIPTTFQSKSKSKSKSKTKTKSFTSMNKTKKSVKFDL
jgi:hypothetical protein